MRMISDPFLWTVGQLQANSVKCRREEARKPSLAGLVLDALTEHGPMTVAELAELTGLTRMQVKNSLMYLKEQDAVRLRDRPEGRNWIGVFMLATRRQATVLRRAA